MACLGVAWILLGGGSARATLPTGFVRTTVTTDLTEPTALAFLPDGRLLVTERPGRIRVIQNGALLAQPMLQITTVSSSADEKGLLGLTVDPNYPTNPYIYAFYTAAGPPQRSRVSRFTVGSSGAANVVTAGSEQLVWQNSDPSAEIHQGGAIHFGPDGKIYIATGDQYTADNAQLLTNQHGKVLRMNPDGTVPSDNPVWGVSGARPEIWAYGFRNPYRFSFDGQNLWLGDVGGNGPNNAEEINRVVGGANFGWPLQEGHSCFVAPNCNAFVLPAFTWEHVDLPFCDPVICNVSAPQAAITMGPVYRATQFPAEYRGNLFVADYANRWIRRFTFDANGVINGNVLFDSSPDSGTIVDLAVGPDGGLYYVTFGLGPDLHPDVAGVFKILWAGSGNLPPTAVANATPLEGLAPLAVQFSSAGSTDPDAGPQPLTYLWTFGDGTTSTAANPQHTYSTAGPYSAHLTVSDGSVEVQSSTLSIRVGTPPLASIVTPADGTTYDAGDVIQFTGTGSDADSTITAASFAWQVMLVHEAHSHPVSEGLTGVTGGSFTIPVAGHPPEHTHYEIRLTITDADGLTSVVTRRIDPNIAVFQLDTVPAGIPVFVDGEPLFAPRTIESLANYQFGVRVPLVYAIDGTLYRFTGWSDGGVREHAITMPAGGLHLVATYENAAPACGTSDIDDDGIPDGCDRCPVDADGEQPDADGDAIGDACDQCPGIVDHGGTRIDRIRVVRNGHLDPLRLVGLAPATFDPAVDGVSLRLTNGTDAFVQITLEPGTNAGRWKGRGARWRFRPHRATANGLESFRIGLQGGRLTVTVRLRGNDLSATDRAAAYASLRIGDDCWSAFSASCRVRARGVQLLCR